MVQNWKIFSPFGLSIYDAFKDNQDVKDLIQHGLLSLTKRLYKLKIDKVSNVVKSYPRARWFCFTSFYDWFRKRIPASQPIRFKKSEWRLGHRVFPRLGAFSGIFCSHWLPIIFILFCGPFEFRFFKGKEGCVLI